MHMFFLVNSSANLQVLLDKNWIYVNQCISSSMHRLFLFWKRDDVEIVEGETQHFQASSRKVEVKYYNEDFEPIKIREKNKKGSSTYMQTPEPSQFLERIFKPNVIVPYRPMIQPLIEEIGF